MWTFDPCCRYAGQVPVARSSGGPLPARHTGQDLISISAHPVGRTVLLLVIGAMMRQMRCVGIAGRCICVGVIVPATRHRLTPTDQEYIVRSPIRRTALIAVAAASGLAMAGCSSSSTPAAAPSSAATSAASAVKLIAPGKLTVCTHLAYAPFQYPDDSGKVVGFDVDIMDLVAKKLNVTQTIVDTPFEGIKSGEVTKTGKCDISAAAMTITDERKKAILFSDGYFNATQALLLPPTSTVKSLADLKGKKLGAQSGTTGLDYANANKAANGYEIIEYQDEPTQRQALLTGQIDGSDQRPAGLERGRQGQRRQGHRWSAVRHR
ncbi:MAG: transporter substrate-binding domain-containing protein [Dermatophilaceae bacterium]